MEKKNKKIEVKKMTEFTDQELAEVIQYRMKYEKYRFYNTEVLGIINEKQIQFHKFGTPIRLFTGGNKSGKTTAIVIEVIWHCTGHYPNWYPEATKRKQPCRVRFIAPDFQVHINENIIPRFQEWIDFKNLKTKKNPIGVITQIVFPNGSKINFMSDEQDIRLSEGGDFDVLAIDEPISRKKWTASQRGLVSSGGITLWAMTPCEGTPAWICYEIWDRQGIDKDISCLRATIRDNHSNTEEFIRRFEKGLTEEQKASRIEGNFFFLSGLVYKEFDRNVHIVKPFRIPADWSRYIIIDPHPHKTWAISFLATHPKGTVYFYDELSPSSERGVGGIVSQIRGKIKSEPYKPVKDMMFLNPENPFWIKKWIMDTSGKARTITPFWSGWNISQELRKGYGIVCIDPNKDVDAGTKKVKEYLSNKKMFIFDNCKETIKSIAHCIWDKGKLGEEFKDFADCVRYGLISHPMYIPPPKKDPLSELFDEQEKEEYDYHTGL